MDVINQVFLILQARERYRKWQGTRWLTPSNLLSQGSYTLTPVMLPYWIFTLEATIHHTGAVCTRKQGDKSADSAVWKDVGWSNIPRYTFSADNPEMMVNAAFQHRRDFVEVLKRGIHTSQAHTLTKYQAETQELEFPGVVTSPVALHLPAMRKPIAWEFALRGAHTLAIQWAILQLKEKYNADEVKNVNAVVSPLRHQVSLMYIPAYSLHYVHGEGHNVHGERTPLKFDGLISGLRK